MGQAHAVDRTTALQTPNVDSLYRDHARQLQLWLATRVPHSNVEDASQAVWSRVAEHYATKFDGGNFRAWLFQIARNYLVDESRRRRLMPVPDETEMVRPDQRAREPYEILIDREHRSRLAACIERLGEPRKAIVKARAAGLEYDEFVAEMNLSNQQASQHFFAAKKLLRACLESSTAEAV
jgi:RNA polymerase sigma-70 factor (ECF subfamily)